MAIAQLPSIPPSTAQLPYGVQRIGLIEATDVRLDGTPVIKIASPIVYDRLKPGEQVPVEVRARQIEANLNQLLESNSEAAIAADKTTTTLLDPKTMQVYTEVLNGQPILLVKDAELAEPRVILTVTGSDAQYHSVTKSELAKRWQQTLQQELREALERRQPEVFRQRVRQVFQVILAMVGATIALFLLWRFLGWRKTLLRQQIASANTSNLEREGQDEAIAVLPDQQPDSLSLLDLLRQQLSLQRRVRLLEFFRWLLFWGMMFTWFIGISTILSWFPQTRGLSSGLVSVPLLILITWFVTGLLNRLVSLSIDRFAKTWEANLATDDNSQRLSLRVSTLVTVLKSIATALVYFLGLVWILQTLQLAVASVLALGTILAVAASFATQNVVKDLVNGFLILLEDQYAIGDFIAVNHVSGRVENLNLRITQIRNDTGNLITVPNSQILQVENMTRYWSRADLRVEVAYHTNINEALTIVREVADELSQDPDWAEFILDTHEVFGIEQISHTGIMLRLWIKTLPTKQWIVAREFRRRLKMAFDKHDIAIGTPKQEITGQLNQTS